MKKQVWLRPDQVDLVISALDVVSEALAAETISGNATRMARNFTHRRIAEVRALFADQPKDVEARG